MAWATVFTGALPTTMNIIDNCVTLYQHKMEALKKDKKNGGGGGGLKNALQQTRYKNKT